MLDPTTDQRLAVVGCSGAGKSTLAAELAERIGSKHTPLDELFFEADWTPRPSEAYRADVAEAASADRWVIDGNYRLVRDLVWSRATTLVWLDYSLATSFSRLLKRTLRRAWTKETVCNGNQESFRMSFASRDSILLYQLQSYRRVQKETAEDLAKPEHAHLRVIHLRKPHQAQTLTTP